MGEITIDWEEGTYTGEVSDNVPNGQGTATYPDGTKYSGEFQNGICHGQGTFILADGSEFIGELEDDEWTLPPFNTVPKE
jgi:hypothetical protein